MRYAIDALAAGQGITICIDVVVSHELQSGTLVKRTLSLPGTDFVSFLDLTTHGPQRLRLSPPG